MPSKKTQPKEAPKYIEENGIEAHIIARLLHQGLRNLPHAHLSAARLCRHQPA